MSKNSSEFWSFIGAWFPDADLEGAEDDQEVVQNFLSVSSASSTEKVRLGFDEILTMPSLPMARIMEDANRHFDSEQECREWLLMCRAILSGSISS